MFGSYPTQGPQEWYPALTTYDGSQDGHAFKLLLRNGFPQDEASETGERMELAGIRVAWPTAHWPPPGLGKRHPSPAQNGLSWSWPMFPTRKHGGNNPTVLQVPPVAMLGQ